MIMSVVPMSAIPVNLDEVGSRSVSGAIFRKQSHNIVSKIGEQLSKNYERT